MSTTQVVTISFQEGGYLVRWEGQDGKTRKREFRHAETKIALGFAWRIRIEERDQPLILMPPNLFHDLLNPFSDTQWNKGIDMASAMLSEEALHEH